MTYTQKTLAHKEKTEEKKKTTKEELNSHSPEKFRGPMFTLVA